MKAGGNEGPVYILRVERCCEGGGEVEREEGRVGERNVKDFERGWVREEGRGEPRERCVWRRSREVRL
jgi:hypothetical protein